MGGNKILIMVRGEIFSFGLRENFITWGFMPVIMVRPDPTQVLALIREHKPVLLVTDLLTWPGGPASRAFLAAPPPVPTLLLIAHRDMSNAQHAILQGVPGYQVLPKPCPVAHLKEAVEALLSVIIPADTPPETVSPVWPTDQRRA
jgi:DNA-binding NarL/FixJ family response regulator